MSKKELMKLCEERGVVGLRRAEIFALYRNGVKWKLLDLACSNSKVAWLIRRVLFALSSGVACRLNFFRDRSYYSSASGQVGEVHQQMVSK